MDLNWINFVGTIRQVAVDSKTINHFAKEYFFNGYVDVNVPFIACLVAPPLLTANFGLYN
jgi:hypothetical protein